MSSAPRDQLGKPGQIKKTRYRVRNMVLWVCIGLLCIGSYFVWRFFHGKAQGVIWIQDHDLVESRDKNTEKRLYKGKFVTFSHSARYEEKTHSLPTSGPVKEVIFLSATDVEGRKIAVTVADRGTANLESDPAFQFRQMTQKEYQSKTFQEGIWQGVLFERSTSLYERTFFFSNKGLIISFSITSPFSGDDLEEELRAMMRSFSLSLE